MLRLFTCILYMLTMCFAQATCSAHTTQGTKLNSNDEKHKFQQKQIFEKRFIKKY